MMSLDDCFGHPLWPVFAEWMYANSRWRRHWQWCEGDSYWRPFWNCFLAGVVAGTKED